MLLRPFGNLLRQTVVGLLAFFSPILTVLYWLTIPSGTWLVVAIVQAAVTVTSALALFIIFGAYIRVAPDGFVERGLFGRVRNVPNSDIGSVMVVEIYQPNSLDTYPQLFAIGVDGRLLLRMRGQFWSRESMDTVCEELGAPVTRVDEAQSLSELGQSRPELLYWFERRPTRRAA